MNKIPDKFFAPGSAVFPQFNGIVVLNKPSGPSSAACLGALKRLGQKKIGHAGTLDPFAGGVLIALLGAATKLSPYLLAGGEKVYSGVLRLGVETDTWDSTGAVMAERGVNVSAEELSNEIRRWQTLAEQPVPPFSAAKHNGVPLYKLARAGRQTPQKLKKIHISQADMLQCDMPFVHFRVRCSSGTYIRSLAHSLGTRLGCGAALCELTREYSHPYDLAGATGLEELARRPELLPGIVKPLASALPHWPQIAVSAGEAARLKEGRTLPVQGGAAWRPGQNALFSLEGEPLVLATLSSEANGQCWRVMRGLWV